MIFFGSISAQKKELRNAGKELDKGNFKKSNNGFRCCRGIIRIHG
jgi:hypothetical protein